MNKEFKNGDRVRVVKVIGHREYRIGDTGTVMDGNTQVPWVQFDRDMGKAQAAPWPRTWSAMDEELELVEQAPAFKAGDRVEYTGAHHAMMDRYTFEVSARMIGQRGTVKACMGGRGTEVAWDNPDQPFLSVISANLRKLEPWEDAMEGARFMFRHCNGEGIDYTATRGGDGEGWLVTWRNRFSRYSDSDVREYFRGGWWLLIEQPKPDPIAEAVAKVRAAREALELAVDRTKHAQGVAQAAREEQREKAEAYGQAQQELLKLAGVSDHDTALMFV